VHRFFTVQGRVSLSGNGPPSSVAGIFLGHTGTQISHLFLIFLNTSGFEKKNLALAGEAIDWQD
jgi:hypothetical protein